MLTMEGQHCCTAFQCLPGSAPVQHVIQPTPLASPGAAAAAAAGACPAAAATSPAAAAAARIAASITPGASVSTARAAAAAAGNCQLLPVAAAAEGHDQVEHAVSCRHHHVEHEAAGSAAAPAVQLKQRQTMTTDQTLYNTALAGCTCRAAHGTAQTAVKQAS